MIALKHFVIKIIKLVDKTHMAYIILQYLLNFQNIFWRIEVFIDLKQQKNENFSKFQFYIKDKHF